MKHYRSPGVPKGLTLISFVIIIAGGSGLLRVDAGAAVITQGPPMTARAFGDGHKNGNGKFNKNDFSYNSPTIQRGLQNVSNQNIGGNNNTQMSFCSKKKLRFCKITQRL